MTEAYLEPSGAPAVGLFSEKSLWLKAVGYFRGRAPSWVFGSVPKCASASCVHGEIIPCHNKRLVSRDNILNAGKNFGTFRWN